MVKAFYLDKEDSNKLPLRVDFSQVKIIINVVGDLVVFNSAAAVLAGTSNIEEVVVEEVEVHFHKMLRRQIRAVAFYLG